MADLTPDDTGTQYADLTTDERAAAKTNLRD